MSLLAGLVAAFRSPCSRRPFAQLSLYHSNNLLRESEGGEEALALMRSFTEENLCGRCSKEWETVPRQALPRGVLPSLEDRF